MYFSFTVEWDVIFGRKRSRHITIISLKGLMVLIWWWMTKASRRNDHQLKFWGYPPLTHASSNHPNYREFFLTTSFLCWGIETSLTYFLSWTWCLYSQSFFVPVTHWFLHISSHNMMTTCSNNNLTNSGYHRWITSQSVHTVLFVAYPNTMLNVYDIKRSDFIR